MSFDTSSSVFLEDDVGQLLLDSSNTEVMSDEVASDDFDLSNLSDTDEFNFVYASDLHTPNTDICRKDVEHDSGHLNLHAKLVDDYRLGSHDQMRRPYRTAGRHENRHMSKNAILARENREKKKQYITGLEKMVCDLTSKNKNLQSSCSSLHKTVTRLRQEVMYLKGVIENQSMLSQLLKNIPKVIVREENMQKGDISDAPSSEFSGSFEEHIKYQSCNLSCDSGISSSFPICDTACERNSVSEVPGRPEESIDDVLFLSEHDYARLPTSLQLPTKTAKRSSAGVCLHVADNTVMLEFCAVCSENAQKLSGKPKTGNINNTA